MERGADGEEQGRRQDQAAPGSTAASTDPVSHLPAQAGRGVPAASTVRRAKCPKISAAAAGMMAGDVILEVGGKAVQNNADFESAIGAADLSRGVMLIVEREGRKTFAILKP